MKNEYLEELKERIEEEELTEGDLWELLHDTDYSRACGEYIADDYYWAVFESLVNTKPSLAMLWDWMSGGLECEDLDPEYLNGYIADLKKMQEILDRCIGHGEIVDDLLKEANEILNDCEE